MFGERRLPHDLNVNVCPLWIALDCQWCTCDSSLHVSSVMKLARQYLCVFSMNLVVYITCVIRYRRMCPWCLTTLFIETSTFIDYDYCAYVNIKCYVCSWGYSGFLLILLSLASWKCFCVVDVLQSRPSVWSNASSQAFIFIFRHYSKCCFDGRLPSDILNWFMALTRAVFFEHTGTPGLGIIWISQILLIDSGSHRFSASILKW